MKVCVVSILLSFVLLFHVSGTQRKIAAHGYHTCAIQTDGQVYCWGNGAYGQLGLGYALAKADIPTAMLNVGFATDVCTGWDSTCVIDNGAVRCTGADNDQSMGNGPSTDNVLTLTTVSGLSSGMSRVACGPSHVCAINNNGGLSCWGYGGGGQLGNNLYSDQNVPVAASSPYGSSGTYDVCGGSFHSCLITTDTNGAHCSGSNADGQLGTGDYLQVGVFTAVSGLSSGVSRISCGTTSTCALLFNDNGVRCWGSNYYGQLGDSLNAKRNVPFTPTGLASGVSFVQATTDFTCAILSSNGSVVCFGDNSNGQLGDGTTENRNHFVYVQGVSGPADAVVGGWDHMCIRQASDGSVQCVGSDNVYQLGDAEERTGDSLVLVTAQGLPVTKQPTKLPTTLRPTAVPSTNPSLEPTALPTVPTEHPTSEPTMSPSVLPSTSPLYSAPSRGPSSASPSSAPIRRVQDTFKPSVSPVNSGSKSAISNGFSFLFVVLLSLL